MKTAFHFIAPILLSATSVAKAYQCSPAAANDAHTLLLAAEQLQAVLASVNCVDYRFVQDAQTLVYAAEHFEEEIRLQPVDLDQDFVTIQQVFESVRNDAQQSREVQGNPQIRMAWFNVEEANIDLRQDWYGNNSGGFNPGRPGPGSGGFNPGRPGPGSGGWGPGRPGPGGPGGGWGPGRPGPGGPGSGWGPGRPGPGGPGSGGFGPRPR